MSFPLASQRWARAAASQHPSLPPHDTAKAGGIPHKADLFSSSASPAGTNGVCGGGVQITENDLPLPHIQGLQACLAGVSLGGRGVLCLSPLF